MKKLILGTAALVTLGITPAFAEEHAGAPAAAAAEATAPVATETAAPAVEAVEAKTIADLAVADADLSTLVSALTAAELTESLKGTGPFTVFAPTNEAFKKLDQAVLADLLKPFRKSDADEAMKLIEQAGFDHLHMAFGKQGDLGNDGVWDNWQIEGPSMIWYFRGAPHVHCWAHIRDKAAV